MAINPYSPCLCGSGKKFKWCCQPIHGQLEKAIQQLKDGQNEAGLRTFDEIIQANPSNPEVYGRKAELLYHLGRKDEAEESIDKAFQINPDYPFGHFLRAQFRIVEGNQDDALPSLRKAAEVYDPNTQGILAQIYMLISDCEMKRNHPVAAHEAMQLAVQLDRDIPDYKRTLNTRFGEDSPLPVSARKKYSFKSPSIEGKSAWKKEVTALPLGKLKAAQKAFQKLVEEYPDDLPAWYNLGLSHAWLGNNKDAISALEEYLRREERDEETTPTGALIEVLRCGDDVGSSNSDYISHSWLYHLIDGPKVSRLLQQLEKDNILLPTQMDDQRQLFTGILLESPTVLTVNPTGKKKLRFAGFFSILGEILQIRSPCPEKVRDLCRDLEQKSEGGLKKVTELEKGAHIQDLLAEALVFPINAESPQEEEAAVLEGFEKFFEDSWIHRPLNSLGKVSPLDAAGSSHLRKKLLGILQLFSEIAKLGEFPYDFDRLRRKLGLIEGFKPESSSTTKSGELDFSSMSAAELAAVDRSTLRPDQLEEAWRAASKLDAEELSQAFLRELVALPPVPDKPDRFPFYGKLIQTAAKNSELDEAMNYVDEGEKFDCENNEGKRRNDYELWRGRVHAKRGEIDTAKEVFDRLIERAPSELKYIGTATESMLSAKDRSHALQFAQQGLTQARKQQDRDSEGYFLELEEAAKKIG